MTTTTIIMCAVCSTIPLCGILAAIVPYLQRRTEVFAVTVPSVAQDDVYVKGLKRKYAVIMLTVNVEELNYLAKRLESFDDGEAAQFQAMAHKRA